MEGTLQLVLGDRLRTIRGRMGLSQEEMADFLGLHRTYIGAIERGERNLTLRSVERIAEGLNVPAIDLLRPLNQSR